MRIRANYLLRVDLIFVLSVALFIVLFVLTFRSAQEVARSRDWEDHTEKVLRSLQQLLSHSLDLETGARSYAVTGDERFMRPLLSAKIAARQTIDSLKALVRDDPTQTSRVDTLSALIGEKTLISEHVVELRNTAGIDSAVAYIASGRGLLIMDSIRALFSRAMAMETMLLKQRIQVTIEKRAQRTTYFVLLMVVTLVLIATAFLFTRKTIVSLLHNKLIQEDLIGELTVQNRQLDDFAHITSHNIRGPASNIRTLVGMLDKDSTLDDYQLIFSKLEKVSANLGETLNDLIEVLQVKKNKNVERQVNDFQELLDREKENLGGEILKSNATIIADFEKAPTVSYPRTYLESILHNLLSNALKYRSADRAPVIHISSSQKDGRVQLTVKDNGLGIDLTRYGDKLFGLRKTFHEHPEARGIGLFMTKAQIETLGGRITVESEPGAGTTFIVRF